jgi:hypothetical protein
MKIDDLINRLQQIRDRLRHTVEVEVRDESGTPTTDFDVRTTILLTTGTRRVMLEPRPQEPGA